MSNEIKMHYAAPGLYERVVQGLKSIGKSPASVDLDDLAALDEFHLRGPAATRELIEILDVDEDSHVLDLESGLGGPARRLAKMTGCRVTGIDLSEDYCENFLGRTEFLWQEFGSTPNRQAGLSYSEADGLSRYARGVAPCSFLNALTNDSSD
ncbi:protein of unknown function [uncultured Woeseiaceae bacterium]|uniref:Methyltransferase domain-containing protein n=1 Tax=uncultured Woeseiaceae bacterium TaxID=1983305 RepID=A0A7D9H6X9_9GAMM|nr:protein of unknown function [uncultured Woeseiaceae bacterium]